MTTTRRRLLGTSLLLLGGAALAGCSGDSASQDAAAADGAARTGGDGAEGTAAQAPSVEAGEPTLPVTFTGDDGVEITVESLENVMVIDDGTIEIIGALGAADLIGIAPDQSLVEDVAAQAGERVTTAGRGSLTVEGVVALDPTLVIGVNMRRHADLVAGLQGAGIPATLIDTSQVAPEKIRRTAELLGIPEAGEELAALVQEQYDEAAAKLEGVEERPRVMVLSSSGAGDSGATTGAGADTPAHEVIEAAGGLNAGAETGLDRYQSVTAEGLVAAAPEVVVVAAGEIEDLDGADGIWTQVAGLVGTPAEQEQRLVVLEDMQIKGGAVTSGLGVLALQAALHPDL